MVRTDLISTLLRRWKLVAGAFVIAVLVGVLAAFVGPVGYTAEAGVLVLPPVSEDGRGKSNPIASLNDATVQLASTLVYVGQSPQVTDAVADRAGATVVVDNTSAGTTQATPFIRITASAGSAGDATSAAQTVVDQLTDRLRALQSKSQLTDEQQSRLSVVVAPSSGQRKAADLLKSGAIGFVVVFVLALVAIALRERLRTSRGRHR